ncbi:hypothetical protein TSUD_359260 [Trifolium subterraneum]|uniref:Uncharacterized protein n=1 Tax=Trifolium subterraneum TaxID=3900 RepID=A0A2Z6MJZ7_TRISU|nr:hypothetical protein TSUD_359260 [Trifolium subterraneum]
MARTIGLLPLFATTMAVMIILFLGLDKVVSEEVKPDVAQCPAVVSWPPSQCPPNTKYGKVYQCTDNFVGPCVPGEHDACCDCLCKHYGHEKGGFCKTLEFKQPAPHNFCHCYC